MSFVPKVHEVYKHFKGNLYQVSAIAEHTETGEQLVIYQELYGGSRVYARPLSMFVSRVDKEKYPDAAQEFRFELQGPEAGRQQAETGEAAVRKAGGAGEESQEAGSAGEAAVRKVGSAGEASQEAGSAGEASREAVQSQTSCEEELTLDPLVLEFLDADSYGQQLNILAGLHHRITDEMITTMAIACDVEIGEGDIEERYEALRSCLMTLERYECNRLR